MSLWGLPRPAGQNNDGYFARRQSMQCTLAGVEIPQILASKGPDQYRTPGLNGRFLDLPSRHPPSPINMGANVVNNYTTAAPRQPPIKMDPHVVINCTTTAQHATIVATITPSCSKQHNWVNNYTQLLNTALSLTETI